mgnify:CR=1 FL=1
MHDPPNGMLAVRKLAMLVRLAPRVNRFIRYNLTISGRIPSCPSSTPLPSPFNLLPKFLLDWRQGMNDKPPTDKLDRDKLHASSVWEPSNRKPSRRSSFDSRRMHSVTASQTLSTCFSVRCFFSVGMDLNIHASSPPSYPISYDESPLSPILKPARVGEQGSKQ